MPGVVGTVEVADTAEATAQSETKSYVTGFVMPILTLDAIRNSQMTDEDKTFVHVAYDRGNGWWWAFTFDQTFSGSYEFSEACVVAQHYAHDRNTSVMVWTKNAHRRVKILDKCQICYGVRGGVPGNENIVDGRWMCDYCHSNHLALTRG